MNLCVELDDVSSPPAQQTHDRWARNGPSRQRRRQRRAAEREAVEVGKHDAVQAEECDSVAVGAAGNAKTSAEEAFEEPTKKTEEVKAYATETLKDEFCSDKSFKESEKALVEQILVTADCQADWNDAVVTKLLHEKLESINIQMKSIEVHRNVRRCFVSCLVTIDPMAKHLIEKEEFPMRRWTMKSVM